MKHTTLIWIVLLSFLLALSGCGDKDTEEPVEAEEVVVEDVEEPELPDEGVHEAGPDITEEVVAPDDDEDEETEDDEETTEDGEDEEMTAQNYRVVSLKDLKAYPEEMTVNVGTTVEWRNVNDNLQHIIGWRGQKQMGVTPEPILAGESWSYTFDAPGEITWFSTARPTIQGTIYIEE
ncbi:hypothetical protein KY349_04940 [Candidatus Woesearchaeota archaeon]|jgi:plastocyanin|nr:hypothetical protein [Candidatus Woesearchaeota archaeon]